MKKVLASIVLALLYAANVSAQSDWTLNTRAWSTNYFTTLLWDAISITTKEFAFEDDDDCLADRIIPNAELVFPYAAQKKGFGGVTEIFCPYTHAFSNPFKNPGDYSIGIDASWKPGFLGAYAGAYFKSQEVVFKQFNNIRGYYFQPRLGLIAGKGDEHAVELGVFYDVLTGSGGRMAGPKKDMLRGGIGFDIAYSITPDDGKHKYLLQISTPLHNFFSKDVERTQGFKRRVGYIMFTSRIAL